MWELADADTYSGRASRLTSEGWEPFGVVHDGTRVIIWFRRETGLAEARAALQRTG